MLSRLAVDGRWWLVPAGRQAPCPRQLLARRPRTQPCKPPTQPADPPTNPSNRALRPPTAQACIASGGAAAKEYEIVNVDRSSLGRVGGAIARKYGDAGFPGTLTVGALRAGAVRSGAEPGLGAAARVPGTPGAPP